MIYLSRRKNDLEILANGQCLLIDGYYHRPRLFTLDPRRSVFTKRRSTLFHLQHQLHMMTGWLGMAVHAKRVLYEAEKMRDGDEYGVAV
jgi:hypothetical protein